MSRNLCIHNGRVYGLNGIQDETALVIEKGIIRYIGDENGYRRYLKDDTRIIDAKGHIVFPGFIDTHLHFTEWARQQDYLQLGQFRSLRELKAYLKEESRGKEWLFGGGWNQNNWDERRFPHRKDLDHLGPDVKAVFYSKDLHSAWVNEAVIDLFPFEDVFNMIKKGTVKRDYDGQLNGILQEEALEVLLDPVIRKHPPGIFSDPKPYFKPFYRHGITSVHSMEYYEEYKKYLKLYQQETNRGLRFGFYLYHADSEKAYGSGLKFGTGGDHFRFYGIKLFTDGALGSQTAWMREPYENTADYFGKKQMHGEELYKAIRKAESRSCALAIHAIGDAAVEHVLDTVEKIGRDIKVPLRIEHAQVLDEELINRLNINNIHLSVNPAHLPDDQAVADLHWGERSRNSYTYRSLKTAGIPFSIGSDAPVESIHPWKAIHSMVHRLGSGKQQPWYPDESLRLIDAIQAYTYYGGMITGMNERKGVLGPGYLGDCFICSHDVFEDGLQDWESIHSLLTVIGGKVVYNEMGDE